MKQKVIVLFRAELKSMSKPLFVYFVVLAADLVLMHTVFLPRVLAITHWTFAVRPHINAITRVFLPGLLLYSLYMEQAAGSVYMLYSLPVKRALHFLVKNAVIFSALVLSLFAVIIWVLLYNLVFDVLRPSNMLIVSTEVITLFSVPFLTFCLLSAAWCIAQTVRRNRLLLGLFSALAGYTVSLWLTYIAGEIIRKYSIGWIGGTACRLAVTLIFGLTVFFAGVLVLSRSAEI